MEIKDFIAKSIEQICFGIRDAQRTMIEENDNNQPVAPARVEGKLVVKAAQEIHFDLAVTITDDEKLNAGGRVGIGVVGGNLEKQNSKTTENTHRISFSVPFFPQALNSSKKK